MDREVRPIADRLFDCAESELRYAFAATRSESMALERRARSGAAVEVEKGYFARTCYLEGLSPRSRSMHLIRAMASKHPNWVFASFSAAIVHGLQVSRRLTDTVHLAMGSHENRALAGDVVTCHCMKDVEFELVDGIRVTPLARTILDCLCQTNFACGLAIVDSALHRDLIGLGGLRLYVKEHGAGRRGVRMARRVLRWADGRSENGGESMARAMIIDLGFEPPELQVEIEDPLRPGVMRRVDYYWRLPDGRVVIGELDGRVKYRGNGEPDIGKAIDVLARERLRESHLSLTGAMVIRFSFAEAMNGDYMYRLLTRAGVPMRR